MATGSNTVTNSGFKCYKVWENANPSSSMANGYLDCDVTGMDLLLIVFKPSTDYNQLASMICTIYPSILCGFVLGGTSKCTRMIQVTNNPNDSSKWIVYVNSGYNGSTNDNKRCVPIIIYSIKYTTTL